MLLKVYLHPFISMDYYNIMVFNGEELHMINGMLLTGTGAITDVKIIVRHLSRI